MAGLTATTFAADGPQQNRDTLAALLGHPLPLEWRLDPGGKMPVADVIASAKGNEPSSFEPVGARAFPHSAGSVWFRFPLPPYEGRSFYLDLNARIAGHVPDGSQAWLVRTTQNPGDATPLPQTSPGLFQLPNASPAPAAIYLRTNGVPSPGFSPMLRESEDLSSVELDGLFWPCLALGACLLLSLLRGIIERREWRLWSSLYIAAALTTLFWGAPDTSQGLPMPQNLPTLLAPGIALLLLPHVGRQLLRSRDNAPGIDLTLILTGIFGLALGLAPLLPGFGWTVRLLPLWPLGLCLLWPTAILAAVCKLPGSKGFALAALLPPLGFLPLLFPGFPGSLGIIKLMPAMALCAGTLSLLLTPTPLYAVFTNRHGHAVPTGSNTPPELTLLPAPEEEPEDDGPALSPFQRQLAKLSEAIDALASSPVQGAILEKMRQLVKAVEDVGTSNITPPQNEKEGFSLHQVVLEAHNSVLDKAEKKNLALSWYMAPQLSRRYKANRNALARVMKLLLESAVQATERGTVHLRVQRMPESNDPGQVMFTVSDTGAGAPPFGRDTAAFCLAWELATRQGGGISLTSGASGTTVVLAVRMQPVGEALADAEKKRLAAPPNLQAAMTSGLRVLIVSDIPASRQLLAYYLDELPHELLEARGTAEAIAIYTQRPGALVIFDGDLPETEVAKAIADLRDFEGEHDLPPASLLALSNNDAQAERLRRAGCTRTLENPVSRTTLRRLVLRLAPPPNTRASSRAFPGGAVFPTTGSASPLKTHFPAGPLFNPTGKILSSSAPKTNTPVPNPLPAPAVSQKAPATQRPEPISEPARQPETPPPGASEQSPQSAGDRLHFLRPAAFDVRSNVGEPKPLPRPAARKEAFATSAPDADSSEPADSATKEFATSEPKETAAAAIKLAKKVPVSRVMPTEKSAASEDNSPLQTPAEAPLPHSATPASAALPQPPKIGSERVVQTTPQAACKGKIPYTSLSPANQPWEQIKEELPLQPEQIAPQQGLFSAFFGIFRRKPRFSAKELGLTAGHSSREWVGEPVPIVKESTPKAPAAPCGISKNPSVSPKATQDAPGSSAHLSPDAALKQPAATACPASSVQGKTTTSPDTHKATAAPSAASPISLLPPLFEGTRPAQDKKNTTRLELTNSTPYGDGKNAPLELTNLAEQAPASHPAETVSPALLPHPKSSPRTKTGVACLEDAQLLSSQDEDGEEIEELLKRLGEQEQALRTAKKQGDSARLRGIAAEMALVADALSLPNLADLSRCIEQEENEEALASLVASALDAAKEARG